MRVRIYFDVLPLVVDLTPEQVEALNDEFSWEPFYDALGDTLTDHLEKYASIEDVVEL